MPARLRLLRKLREKADKSREAVRANDELPREAQRDNDALQARWRAEVARAEEEAMAIVRETLGIGQYSVLHMIREGGYESWFQLRSANLMRDFAFNREAWYFDGTLLKKDKSLGAGSRRGGMGFKIAFMERRRLDGHWERVRPIER